MGATVEYTLPICQDPEGLPLTVSAVRTGYTGLPSFVGYDGSTLTMYTTSVSDVGTYQIEVSCSDQVSTTTSYFNIIVTNDSPPHFATSPVAQTVIVSQTIHYTLPTYEDPENLPVTATAVQ
jgi:hypothetical protein